MPRSIDRGPGTRVVATSASTFRRNTAGTRSGYAASRADPGDSTRNSADYTNFGRKRRTRNVKGCNPSPRLLAEVSMVSTIRPCTCCAGDRLSRELAPGTPRGGVRRTRPASARRARGERTSGRSRGGGAMTEVRFQKDVSVARAAIASADGRRMRRRPSAALPGDRGSTSRPSPTSRRPPRRHSTSSVSIAPHPGGRPHAESARQRIKTTSQP
jgi:hypothetical protein